MPDDDRSPLDRRGFFRRALGRIPVPGEKLVEAAESLQPGAPRRAPPPRRELPMRILGRTGERVPILGFGTAALGRTVRDAEAIALLNEAVDLGVSYLDTATAEGGYGRAHLQAGEVARTRRREVFLTTKVFEADGDAAWRQLERSLKELQVEQVDLLFAHSIGHDRMDPKLAFGPNGVLRMVLEAKRQGMARWVGVSCHNRPARLLRALEDYPLDVMMTPANFVDARTYGFETGAWPLARRQGMGLVAMKVYGGVRGSGATPAMMPRELQPAAFRYALTLDGCATAVVGMLDRRELHENVNRARSFQPLGAEELRRLNEVGPPLAEEWGPHLGAVE